MATETQRKDTLHINMGPSHPSTHGVLRLELELDGEVVVSCKPGHRLPPHRHREDVRGQDTYLHGLTLTDRMDYLQSEWATTWPTASASRSCSSARMPERATVGQGALQLAELTRINLHHSCSRRTAGFDLERKLGVLVRAA